MRDTRGDRMRAAILFALPLLVPLTMPVARTETHAASRSVDAKAINFVAAAAAGDVDVHDRDADRDKITVATLWVGLEGSGTAGLKVDLLVNVFANGALITSGHLVNRRIKSGGFSNAILHKISLSPGSIPDGAEVEIKVSARRACSGGEPTAGIVRLWYNGRPVDRRANRDAGSRVELIVDRVTDEYFLREGLVLNADPGSVRTFVDAHLSSDIPCPDRPFTSFGTWSIALP